MSSTTQPTTFEDLYTDLIDKAGGSSSQSGVVTRAKRYINSALHDMHTNPAQLMPWAIRRGVLLTNAPYSTGTISITTATSRTAVTGSGTLWNTDSNNFGFNNVRVGGKIKLGSTSDVYEVSAVSSDTALTLATRYTGSTLSGQSYQYFEDEYALAADFWRISDLRLFSSDLNIPLVGPMEFRRMNVRNDTVGRPRYAAIIEISPSGSAAVRPRVVLSPVPDAVYSIPYAYATTNLAVTSAGVEQAALSATTDEPIVPLRYRHAIVLNALYHWYRDPKDDTRSQEAKAEYVEIMTRVMNDFNMGRDHASLHIAPRSRGRAMGQYDVGGRFDRLED